MAVKGIIGAVIGDVVGSRFELPVGKNFPKYNFKWLGADSTFTDDTVLTVAIADALLHGKKFEDVLWEWGHKYKYAGWGGRFRKWLKGSKDERDPGTGNGCGMRISPVGFYAKSLKEVHDLAEKATLPTHGSPEGLKGAKAIASAVFLARKGKTKKEIEEYTKREFGYNLDFTREEIVEKVKAYQKGEVALAENSIPVAIKAFLESEGYEDAIRKAITYAGDTDTIACMAGGIAAAFYGVPDDLAAEVAQLLPEDLLAIINEFDKTDFQSARVTPGNTREWNVDSIRVYGSGAEGEGGEDGSAEVIVGRFNRQPRPGYPIRTIGVEFDAVQKAVGEFIKYVGKHPEKVFLVKKVGLGKSGWGAERMAPLFLPLRNKINVYLPKEFLQVFDR